VFAAAAHAERPRGIEAFRQLQDSCVDDARERVGFFDVHVNLPSSNQ
jgi:hypothetical protein